MQRLFSRILAVILLSSPILCGAMLHAQRDKDPLNDQEADQIADARDQPNERVKLYQKFLQQRIDEIKSLGPSPSGEDRKADLRAKYEEFTRIADELQDNLDTFDEAHADMRKALKDLVPAAAGGPTCSIRLRPIAPTTSHAKPHSMRHKA